METTEKKIEVMVKRNTAETMYIRKDGASYGIFCYNEVGDLFLNSDWGMYSFAWRSFGASFKEFLKHADPEYIFDKFDTNSRYLYSKGLPKHVRKPVIELLQEFQNALRSTE